MKILVIDDEPLIHISIEKLIERYSSDIEVMHAFNGQEMQALIQQHDFLIAYVDIKLPGMSGLEAIRLAKETAPNTIYYIMTGFDKFEYAKEAIKLKVEDYLMKPLDFETIKNTIEAAVRIHNSYIRERKTLFRNWLESVLNNRECPLDRFDEYYRFVVLITTDKKEFSLEQLLDKLMPYSDNFVSTYTSGHILLLCYSANADLLRTIRKNLSAGNYEDGITFFTSSIVRNNADVRNAVKYLLQLSCLRVILGIENYYTLKPLMDYDPQLVDFCKIVDQWKTAFQNKSYNDFINLSETICSMIESDLSLDKYRSQIYGFMNLVIGDELLKLKDTDNLRDVFHRQANTFLQTSDNKRLVDSIVQYIDEHFCDNISTTMLSEQFGLSSNYISNLLKQELGIRYNDYITQLRMDHSKQLLITTSMSVKQITMACGYYSQSHFTKLFVDREGCTPLEYRKIHKALS